MGQPKPPMLMAGSPLIEYPISAARSAGLEPWVIAKAGTDLPELDCKVIEEPAETFHPLNGIVTALETARGRPILAMGADMPFLDEWLLAWLASKPGTTVTEAAGRIQPLLARYVHEDAEPLLAALDADRPATEAVLALDPERVPETDLVRFGDPYMLTFNVNTPADLAEAEQIAAARPVA